MCGEYSSQLKGVTVRTKTCVAPMKSCPGLKAEETNVPVQTEGQEECPFTKVSLSGSAQAFN